MLTLKMLEYGDLPSAAKIAHIALESIAALFDADHLTGQRFTECFALSAARRTKKSTTKFPNTQLLISHYAYNLILKTILL